MAASARQAALRSAPGSTAWIVDENAQVAAFCGQEVDEFKFSARNEFDWLNEHMAEIFTREQINVADIFKTPGKLRGKTPRTVRKGQALKAREPLSEISTTAKNSTPRSLKNSKTKQDPEHSPQKIRERPSPLKMANFDIARDIEARESPLRDADEQENTIARRTSQKAQRSDLPQTRKSSIKAINRSGGRPSAETRHDPINATMDIPRRRSSRITMNTLTGNAQTSEIQEKSTSSVNRHAAQILANRDLEMADLQKSNGENRTIEDEVETQDIGNESPSSDSSSNGTKTVVRKSSLSFATLPARDPIPTKKSFGMLNRTRSIAEFSSVEASSRSQTHPEISQAENAPLPNDYEYDAQVRSKSTTQRLHEKINLLSKIQAPRLTNHASIVPEIAASAKPDLTLSSKKAQSPIPFPKFTNEEEAGIVAAEAAEFVTLEVDHSNSNNARTNQSIISGAHLNTNATTQLSPPVDQRPLTETSDAAVDESVTAFAPQMQPLPQSTGSGYYAAQESQDKIYKASEAVQGSKSVDPPSEQADDNMDGNKLTASKTRLQSMMKTARGLFSSSAGLSAAQTRSDVTCSPKAEHARVEPEHVPKSIQSPSFKRSDAVEAREQTTDMTHTRTTRGSTEKEARKRASEDQIEDAGQNAKIGNGTLQAHKADETKNDHVVEQGRPAEPQRPPFEGRNLKSSPRKNARPDASRAKEVENQNATTATSTTTNLSTKSTNSLRAKDARRPMRPAKETILRTKAPPLNIRVGMPSQRLPLTNTTLANNLQESLPAASAPNPVISKKSSTASLSSASNHTSKNASVVAKPKALIVAERKKEQDEREAQRKAEQKREIEKRRNAQQEEMRRQEQAQKQAADRQRERERAAAAALDESKKAAHRQAMEKRRLEMQQREQASGSATQSHSVSNTAPRLHQTGDSRATRPLPIPDGKRQAPAQKEDQQMTSTKGTIKRVVESDAVNEMIGAAPASTTGMTQPIHQAKRRKTDEAEMAETTTRSTMAPPIRQSNIIRKDLVKASHLPSHAGNGGTTGHGNGNPVTQPLRAPSLLRSATAHQTMQQMNHPSSVSSTALATSAGHIPPIAPAPAVRPIYNPDTSKYRDGNRIPFAENANAASLTSTVNLMSSQTVQGQASSLTASTQPFKTPLPVKIGQGNNDHVPSHAYPHGLGHAPLTQMQANRASPQYANGENIQLAEIPTDSEEDDDDSEYAPDPKGSNWTGATAGAGANKRNKAASLPEWAQSPQLRELLERQEDFLDADAVFGPVASPHMEEMFRERQHRFRSRTSSANWAGSDRLTEEEIRRDVEARARMRRDGGWTFGL